MDNPEQALAAFPTIFTLDSESPGLPRCMPGDYDISRNYPFLLEWTNQRVLYSSTDDPTGIYTTCRSDFVGTYTVRTLLNQR
jgi:hypothetical protein